MQMLGHSTPYHPASTPGMSGQYPGAYGGPMGQQQSLHQMQSENQRMMNELQRIRQMGGGAMPEPPSQRQGCQWAVWEATQCRRTRTVDRVNQ